MLAKVGTLRRVDDEECADTRDTYDERDENLQECSEDHTFLSLREVFRSQTFLYDILVEAPVAEVGEPQRTEDKDYARAVEIRV